MGLHHGYGLGKAFRLQQVAVDKLDLTAEVLGRPQ